MSRFFKRVAAGLPVPPGYVRINEFWIYGSEFDGYLNRYPENCPEVHNTAPVDPDRAMAAVSAMCGGADGSTGEDR